MPAHVEHALELLARGRRQHSALGRARALGRAAALQEDERRGGRARRRGAAAVGLAEEREELGRLAPLLAQQLAQAGRAAAYDLRVRVRVRVRLGLG